MDSLKQKLYIDSIDVKKKLEHQGYYIVDTKVINYGIQIYLSKNEWKGIIRIFINKKEEIRYDYSPINDKNIKNDIAFIIEEKEPDSNDKIHTRQVRFFPLIGTDESGKGDYFGPLVVAGVFVNNQTKIALEKIGVKDSKKISDSNILILADKVKYICKGQYAIIEISPETYNNLYDNFKKENKNLNTLLAWGHAKAIEEVLTKVDCDNALSDKFADEKFIISKLQEKGKRINLRQEHKAESNIAVAAASILARARFLEKLGKLSQEYKTTLSKGVSKDVIEQANKLIVNGGDTLRKVAKLHFKTTESLNF